MIEIEGLVDERVGGDGDAVESPCLEGLRVVIGGV